MTDQDIVNLIRDNKYSPAMKSLYAYLPVVKKFVLKNNGTKQEAEDIFQEGLVIFCSKVNKPGFLLTCNINTYVYSVCRLLWLDELKKKNKIVKNKFMELSDGHLTDDMSHDIEEDKPLRNAQEAIMQLGEKCKQLLELFYFKKLSMKEIAKIVGFASEKGAKNQKYRCIEKAKENLKNSSL
ncbi:MAG: sigma-70 family RNA polymerase sigma factor [Bacteroidota bacterium]